MSDTTPTLECKHEQVYARLSLGDVKCVACGMIAPMTEPIDWSKGVVPQRITRQADVTDVRPLDLEAARKAVEPLVRAELAAERWPDSERDRLERALASAEQRIAALQGDVEQLRDLLQRARRYVVAHDYTRRGMLLGPPPVGAVLRDLIAAIDDTQTAATVDD